MTQRFKEGAVAKPSIGEEARVKRRDVLLASVIGVTSLGGPIRRAFAETQSVKDKLVGAWSLAAIYDETADGVHHESWGPGVEGLTIYTASGHFSAQATAANRDKAASKDPRVPVGLSIAYFGSYSVDESAMTLALHIERCSFPGWDGVDRVSKIEMVSEGELRTVAATAHLPDLGDIHPHQRYRRVG
jgi:hypothetical protein